MGDWVREEAVRQVVAFRDRMLLTGTAPPTSELAECCLRAGLLEAAKLLDQRAGQIRGLFEGRADVETIIKTWEIAAGELRALAGEEPKL